MDSFKKALKVAISEKVDYVRFETNKSPCISSANNTRQLPTLPGYPANELIELINMILPDQQEDGELLSGELSIVGFGDLELLAIIKEEIVILSVILPPVRDEIRAEVIRYTKENSSGPKGPATLDLGDSSLDFEIEKKIDISSPSTPNDQSFPGESQKDSSKIVSQDFSQTIPSSSNDRSPPTSPDPSPLQSPSLAFKPSHQIPDGQMEGQSNEDDIKDNRTMIIDEQTTEPEPEPEPEPSLFTYLGKNEPDDLPIQDGSQEVNNINTEETIPSDIIKDKLEIDDDNTFFPASYQQENKPTKEDYFEEESAPEPINENLDNQDIQKNLAYSHENKFNDPDMGLNISNITEPINVIEEKQRPQKNRSKKIIFGSEIPGETIPQTTEARAIDEFLHTMVENRASDLHITYGKVISFRIDGEITQVATDIITEHLMEKLLLPIIPPRNKVEFIENNDTDFAYEVEKLGRFRVNLFRDRHGVGAVFRHIPDKILTADELGLSSAIRKLCTFSKGLVLVTGPTGSGKSTTLAAMIDLINSSRAEHILTIEDPIEFIHPSKKCLVRQREVGRHTKSFASGLRAALREDPDIILIGEMRDLETISKAIETAETGHLVFGTLHTNTAISTIDRLIDQFPPDQQEQIRVMLAESLRGVISQTLVKKTNGGRVAAHEILMIDKAVSNLIRESNLHLILNHMQTQKIKGNQLLNDHLVQLVEQKIISPDQAYYKAVEKESLLKTLQQRGLAGNISEAS